MSVEIDIPQEFLVIGARGLSILVHIIQGAASEQTLGFAGARVMKRGRRSKMGNNFVYSEQCPVADHLRQVLADGVEDMEAEDTKALLIYAAETLERQHEYLKSIFTSMKAIDGAGQRMT